MKVASLFSSGRDEQRGASGPTSVTPWRRRDLLSCLKGQDRMPCSKASGSKPQRGQEVSASGPPCRVGGQITFTGSHLVDSPRNEPV